LKIIKKKEINGNIDNNNKKTPPHSNALKIQS
jgi:hypothetical protein